MSVYTNDVDSLRQMISTALAQVFSSLITIVATFTSMVVLSIPLTLVSVLMAVVMMLTTAQLGKRSRRMFSAQQKSLASINGFIEEMMTGQKVVKVFCHEQQAIDEFEQIKDVRTFHFNQNQRIVVGQTGFDVFFGNISFGKTSSKDAAVAENEIDRRFVLNQKVVR